MNTTLIKFPAVSFRKIVSPYEKDGANTYLAVVSVKDIPVEFEDWRGLNPRDPRLTSGVAKKVFATLEDNPESFFFRNRGITLIANRVNFDNKVNRVELEMDDKSKNGLLDGGHTFQIIRNFIAGLPTDELRNFDAYVKVEIIEGIKELDAVVDIVESRNTSTQVKEQSLEELKKHYEAIKEVLKEQSYANRIAYKEFELAEDGNPKDIDIKDILSYLMCFDADGFNENSHPIVAYSTRSNVVKHFRDHQDRMLKYVPLLPEILKLHDEIYLDLPEAYNDAGGHFGQLTGVTEVSNRPRMERVTLPFTAKESRYRIPSGFIYPILAAFRNVIDVKNDKCSWKIDPIKFFKELKGELVKRVGEQAIEFRNPNKLGKDTATWRMCYDVVALETLKRHL